MLLCYFSYNFVIITSQLVLHEITQNLIYETCITRICTAFCFFSHTFWVIYILRSIWWNCTKYYTKYLSLESWFNFCVWTSKAVAVINFFWFLFRRVIHFVIIEFPSNFITWDTYYPDFHSLTELNCTIYIN